jgi:prepilin-type N-terminal cleavage/methylation domain-containing protein
MIEVVETHPNFKNAFTLIEMAAVIVIVLVLIGISLPLLNRGSSHHETKLVTFSIQNLMSYCNTMARSAGKVYVLDLELDYSYSIPDPSSTATPPPDIYRTKAMLVYWAYWDSANDDVAYKYANESFEIPVTIGAYFNSDSGDEDLIYFKPDGSLSAKGGNILVCPDGNHQMYYKIITSKATGNIDIQSYKD